MSWLITDLSSPIGPTELTIVGSTVASDPVQESSSNSGSIVVIPVPVETQAGDLLISVLHWSFGGANTIIQPSGWTVVTAQVANDSFETSSRIATSSEPIDYTWDCVAAVNQSRAGCIIAIRGANPILGDSDRTTANGTTVPDLTNNVGGSMLVAFEKAATNIPPMSDALSGNTPLVDQIQHSSRGTAGYAIPANALISVEENLSVGLISGRSFQAAGATTRTAGIIVEAA